MESEKRLEHGTLLLSEWLVSIGFKQSKMDPAVYTILQKSFLYIMAVYVDV